MAHETRQNMAYPAAHGGAEPDAPDVAQPVWQSAQQRFSLAGRSVLVTGASSGLGWHFAQTLAQAGAAVTVAARRTDRLAALVAAIAAAGGQARAVALDVTSRASVAACLDAMGDAPDIVVNNAGVTATCGVLAVDDAQWDAIVDTNLKGAWLVAQEAARRMAAAGRGGSIINITSILAERVGGGVGPYCAAKAGLAQLTRSMALELARHGIRVNALAPGYVATELNEAFLQGDAGARLRDRIPMRRFGQCADLDGPLLLLASDAGRYITGAQLAVDGGHLCSGL